MLDDEEEKVIRLVEFDEEDYDSRVDALDSLRLKYEAARKVKHHCPVCFSLDTIPIIYGYPSHEMFEKSEAGEIHLGGCEIMEDAPDRYCKACGSEWKPGCKLGGIRFELFIEPTFGGSEEDGGTAYTVLCNDHILVKKYFLGEPSIPHTIRRLYLPYEVDIEIDCILSRYWERIQEMPEELDNGSCDGAYWHYTFGSKTITSLNPHKIDLDPLDNPRLSEEDIQTIRYNNTLMDIYNGFAEILKGLGIE